MKVLSLNTDGSYSEVTIPANSFDNHYVHYQNTPSTEWIVKHNLGKRPAVTVMDSSGAEVDCDVLHIDENEFHVLPGAEFSGSVTCN